MDALRPAPLTRLRPAHVAALSFSPEPPLALEITDGGAGGVGGVGGPGLAGGTDLAAGHGLAGMRERVSMHGGQFSAAPLPAGGFRVAARFPLTGKAA